MRLVAQSYGYIGWTQFWGAFFSYYVVVNDFGFPPGLLNGKATIDIIKPAHNDMYNPNSPYFGNSEMAHYAGLNQCPPKERLDWISNTFAGVDLRMAGHTCAIVSGVTVYTPIFKAWGDCRVYQLSPFSDRPVCYTV